MIWSERPKPGIFSEPVRNSIRLPRQIRENHIKDSSSYLIQAATLGGNLNMLSSKGYEHIKFRSMK